MTRPEITAAFPGAEVRIVPPTGEITMIEVRRDGRCVQACVAGSVEATVGVLREAFDGE